MPDRLDAGEIEPHAELEQLGPVTLHVTPRFAGSFVTVATSGKVLLIGTEPVCGEIVTTAAGRDGAPWDIVI